MRIAEKVNTNWVENEIERQIKKKIVITDKEVIQLLDKFGLTSKISWFYKSWSEIPEMKTENPFQLNLDYIEYKGKVYTLTRDVLKEIDRICGFISGIEQVVRECYELDSTSEVTQ